MAVSGGNSRLKKLEIENGQLRAENKRLRAQLAGNESATEPRSHRWRTLGAIICACLATALLVAGNILFWTGNTIVKTDRYVDATAPLIRNSQIQGTLANNISQQLFKDVDIEGLTAEALPPRADFLAPTIASQVQQHADDTIKKVLQRPQFQARWNNAQARAHDRFISTVQKHGSDGSIDLGEVYSDVSQQLEGTKLSFLANKPLPAKAGNIQIVSGGWLTALQKTINNIDTWRFLSILLLVVFSILSVWLSRHRRKTVIILGSLFAAGMFVTLIAIRLAREIAASQVDATYSEAVRQAYTIVLHSLVVQTATILCASLLIVLVAWISGESRSSRAFRLKVDQLFSGKLHEALFHGENGFTLWIGRNKTWLQWLAVALVACSTLLVRLTPGTLLVQIIILILVVLLIEVLAASKAAINA